MKIIAIDPGSVSAAFAILDGDDLTFAGDVPVVDKMVDGAGFARLVDLLQPTVAIIEQVSAMPKQGVTSSFRFGMGTGILRGVIAGAGVPLHQVAATKWKKHFGLNNEAEKSRALAIRLWPEHGSFSRVKDHNRAEAALLARYLAETMK